MDIANSGEREPARRTAPDQPRQGRRPADTFSNRLILTIRLTGLTIREFAEAAGLDDGSVSNWTHGMRPRDMVAVCQAIADAHDIEFDWLLLGGELLPARGRPVKRPTRSTDRYSRVALCPSQTGTKGLTRSGTPAQAVRRSNVIVRSHPAAA